MAYYKTSWQNGENKDTTNIKTQIPRLCATRTQLNHKTCNRRTQSFGVMRSKTKRQTSEWIPQCDQVRQFENHTDSNGETSSILSKDRQSSCVTLFWVEVRLFQKPGKEFVVFLWDSVALFRQSRCVLDCFSRLQCVDCYGDHILVWWNKGAGYIDL